MKMGLDLTHDCWHGAYSAFARWRQHLAKVAGYAIAKVEYQDGSVMDTIMIDWGHIPDGALMGEWEKNPDDPLLILIAHSDCDGYIYPEQLKPLADRLTALLPSLDGDGGGHVGSYVEKTQIFIDGLLLAHGAGEKVEFG
jgi:hypothetical protein